MENIITNSMENIITSSMENNITNTEAADKIEVEGNKINSPSLEDSTTMVSSIPVVNITPTRTQTITLKSTTIPETAVVISKSPPSCSLTQSSQLQATKAGRRTSETTGTVHSTCPVCGSEATKKKNAVDVLKCSACSQFVHFACTNLPPYQLYKFSKTASKFTCESCVSTPEQFLTDMVTNLCHVCDCSKVTTQLPAVQAPITKPMVDNRYEILENKVNELSVALEKFDLQSLSDKLGELGNTLQSTNNNMTANMKAIDKLRKDTEKKTDEPKVIDNELGRSMEAEALRNEVSLLKKELSASQNSNELLLTTITERDDSLSTLRDRLEKTLLKHKGKDDRILALETENIQIKHANTTIHNQKEDQTEQWSMKTQTLLSEKEQFSQSLDEVSSQLNKVKASNATYAEVNALLKSQIEEVTTLNKSLQESIDRLSRKRKVGSSRDRADMETNDTHHLHETDSEEDDDEDGQADVVILHDSLCKNINDTIMSREKVNVKKVWAPDMVHMDAALDEVNAKVIVLQAWTRDVSKLSVEDMNEKIVEVINKALTKAEKVVVSTIVNRNDIADINLKVNTVNASLLLKYTRDESVIVCDNSTWYHRDFHIADKLHLNDEGTSALASNLKYAMAEAIGVRVIQKKPNRSNYSRQRRHDSDDRRYNRYRGQQDHRDRDRYWR